MFHRTIICVCAVALNVLTGHAVAQLLPPVQPGDIKATLSSWSAGFPVSLWTSRGGVDFYFGPTDLASSPGNPRQFVVSTHNGQAFTVSDEGQVQATPFLDFTDPASPSYSEHFEATPIQGFTSIAFHPGFADRQSPGYGRFYTLESENVAASAVDFADSIVGANHHHESVYEYTLTDHTRTVCDDACVASKRNLMRVDQPGLHHNLGDLIFGHDEMLYISSGDGNNAANFDGVGISDNSQLLSNVYGKILRIDPLGSDSTNGQYGVPKDNPFVDGPGGRVDEIFAYGLRNPYRMALDRETGELYTSETGQLNIESVYRLEPGGNYGWNLLEGSFLYDKSNQSQVQADEDHNGNGVGDFAEENGFLTPVLEYDHQSGLAIVGSVVYRGQQFPELYGKYVFADHFGKLFYGDLATGEILEFQLTPDSQPIPALVFGINEDAYGELYVMGRDHTR